MRQEASFAPAPHCLLVREPHASERQKVLEKTRPVRMTGKAKGRGQEERNRMQARGTIKKEKEES